MRAPLQPEARPPKQPSRQVEQLRELLAEYLSPINTEATIKVSCARCGVDPEQLTHGDVERLAHAIKRALFLYLDHEQLTEAREAVGSWGLCGETRPGSRPGEACGPAAAPEVERVGTQEFPIVSELDVCKARSAALDFARQVGFRTADAVKIATVVSELGRNQLRYADHGTIRLRRLLGHRQGVEISARDQGPGMPDVDRVLADDFRSDDGKGLGLRGSRRIMDDLAVSADPQLGTRVTARKYLSS